MEASDPRAGVAARHQNAQRRGGDAAGVLATAAARMTRRPRRAPTALAAVAVLCLVTLPVHPAQAGVEVSNSVILVSFQDVEPSRIEGKWQRQCEAVINNAKQFKSRSISLVVTAHWAGGRRGVDYYTIKEAHGGQSRMDAAVLRRWENGLSACFKAATAAGFTRLHVLTHLDDPTGLWRNGLVFDPTKQYGGYSYSDVVLMPAARALAAAVHPGVTVEFVLGGEMGRSLLTFPKQYMGLMGPVRTAVQSNPSKPGRVLLGVSLNWSRHCSCTGTVDRDPVRFNESYAGYFNSAKDKLWKAYDVNGFKSLLYRSDFIGLSGYGVLPPSNVQPSDFQVPVFTLAYELSFWGVNLRDVVKDKPLVFSEWGLGGSGRTYGGIAQNSYEAGRFPVHGKWMDYDANSDPWRRSDLREYRRQVYDALTQWLSNGGGPTWKVEGFYLWSVGSWDVLNIHPVTENARGTFGDREVQKKVLALNGRVNGMR